eukprot:scaffold79647_cov59-Phaeocystis_antarctica.AAC.1
MVNPTSAGSTEPSLPSVVKSAAERPLWMQLTDLASRSFLQLLLPQRRRQKHPQPTAGAAEVPGEARLKRVAQLADDDAVLVGAELRQRHRGARAFAAVGGNARHFFCANYST